MKSDCILGIHTFPVGTSARVVKQQMMQPKVTLEDKPMASPKYHDITPIYEEIEVTSFKRSRDDDRIIKKGQRGKLAFSTSCGNMFVFDTHAAGEYCGQYMDSNNSIKFKYLPYEEVD